jgi:hypothetical protein
MRIFVLQYLLILVPVIANAECSPAGGYDLFNPVPKECMREMSTDRPDFTESAYSVPAGHIQVEANFVNWTHDSEAGTEQEETILGGVNFKLGLTDNSDIQFVFDITTIQYLRATEDSPRERQSGFSDLTIRYKHNLFGNDSGNSALALMPYVTMPTGSDAIGQEDFGGGLIVPFNFDISERFAAGLMTQLDYLEDSDLDGHHYEFHNSATVGYSWNDELGTFIEFVSSSSREAGASWQGIFNVGFTYLVAEDVQLDGGMGFGVNKEAPDLNAFWGISFRR